MIALLLVTAIWGVVLTGEVLIGKLRSLWVNTLRLADEIGSTAAKCRAGIKPRPQRGRVEHVEFSKVLERWRGRKADGILREERRDWQRGETGPRGSGHLPGVGACGSESLLGMGAFSVALDVEISKPDCVLTQSCPVPGGGRLLEKSVMGLPAHNNYQQGQSY